jgi:hypothetical protein
MALPGPFLASRYSILFSPYYTCWFSACPPDCEPVTRLACVCPIQSFNLRETRVPDTFDICTAQSHVAQLSTEIFIELDIRQCHLLPWWMKTETKPAWIQSPQRQTWTFSEKWPNIFHQANLSDDLLFTNYGFRLTIDTSHKWDLVRSPVTELSPSPESIHSELNPDS